MSKDNFKTPVVHDHGSEPATEPEKQIAYLEYSVNVDCPACGESVDITASDDDNVVSGAIFGNKWDALNGHDVVCIHCLHEFQIAKVEY